MVRSANALLLFIICQGIVGAHCLQFNVQNTGNVYQFSETENMGDGEILGTVVCTEDGGASLIEDVQYEIAEPGSVPFELDIDSGQLTLKNGETLDFETVQQYEFNITCKYTSMPTNATATIRFSVLPVNEFLPEIPDSSLTLTISELTPVGTVLVSTDSSGLRQIMVTDDDEGPDGVLTFSTSSDLPDFTLNADTGSLTLTQTIDLDSADSGFLSLVYTLVVCDGDRPMDECLSVDVRIIIRAANDNSPVFEQDEYTLTLSETTPVDTNLTTVMCTDADRHGAGEFSGITVEPADHDTPVYIPDPTNGTIVLRESLDFEDRPTLTVNLVCVDSGGLNDTASLQITVTNENDNPPDFNISQYSFDVNRFVLTGQVIGRVHAADLDRDELTYMLLGPGADKFTIRNDGTLVLNSFIFLAESSSFDLMVRASDGTFQTDIQIFVRVNGAFSLPEVIIIAVCGLLVFIVMILICICCLRRKRRSKTVDLSRQLTNGSTLPNPPDSPYIEMNSHSRPMYRLNSLNRDTTTRIDEVPRYIELPECLKASTVIINELGGEQPAPSDSIYSEVQQRVEPEANYVELGSTQLEQEIAAHSRSIYTVPEMIPEEDSDDEIYDDFNTTSTAPVDMALSCPSLPSLRKTSTRPAADICMPYRSINKDLDWGTIPESQLKKNAAKRKRK